MKAIQVLTVKGGAAKLSLLLRNVENTTMTAPRWVGGWVPGWVGGWWGTKERLIQVKFICKVSSHWALTDDFF